MKQSGRAETHPSAATGKFTFRNLTQFGIERFKQRFRSGFVALFRRLDETRNCGFHFSAKHFQARCAQESRISAGSSRTDAAGDAHVDTFSRLLEAAGWDVRIVARGIGITDEINAGSLLVCST